MTEHHQMLGGSGAQGVGYARAGRAWARRSRTRRRDCSPSRSSPTATCMYSPGVLWTAAHHKIPILYRDAQQPRLPPGGDARAAHGRACTSAGRDRARIGTTIDDPNDRLREARAGVGRLVARARSAIRRSSAPRISRALEVVKSGAPGAGRRRLPGALVGLQQRDVFGLRAGLDRGDVGVDVGEVARRRR